MAAFDPDAGRVDRLEVALLATLVVVAALAASLVRKAQRALGGV